MANRQKLVWCALLLILIPQVTAAPGFANPEFAAVIFLIVIIVAVIWFVSMNKHPETQQKKAEKPAVEKPVEKQSPKAELRTLQKPMTRRNLEQRKIPPNSYPQ